MEVQIWKRPLTQHKQFLIVGTSSGDYSWSIVLKKYGESMCKRNISGRGRDLKSMPLMIRQSVLLLERTTRPGPSLDSDRISDCSEEAF